MTIVTPPEVVVVDDIVAPLVKATLPLTRLLLSLFAGLDITGFMIATGVVVVVVSSSKDVTTELVIVTIVAPLLLFTVEEVLKVVVEDGAKLFFFRTQASTFSLNSTGYVEHSIVASRKSMD